MKNLLFFALIFCAFVSNLHADDCTTVYLVRHGQTDWNQKGRIQTIEDFPINQTGKKQSQDLAEKFKNIPFKAVFSSGLTRANQTALILVGERSLKVVVDKRFIERSYGSWEGKPKKEYQDARPEQKCDVEKDSIVNARAMEALTDIALRYPGDNVLIVSHGGVLRNVIANLLKAPPTSIKPENAGYVILKYCDGEWVIKDMNDITKR